MDRISMAEAEQQFSELIARAEAGETVEITRDGKPIVQLTAAKPKQRIDIAELRKVTDGQKMQSESAVDLVRRMRDENRY